MLPGALGGPGVRLVEPGEHGDELVAPHRPDLVEGDGAPPYQGHGGAGRAADVEEHHVEDHGGEGADGDAGAEEDAQPRGHRLGDGGLQGDQHREADRGGDDDGVAVVAHVGLGEGLYADDGDRGEHRQGGAADDGLGDGGHDRSRLGQDPEDDHEGAGGRDDPPGLDAGEAHEPDVLGEARVGEGVEDPAQEGGEPVGAQRVRDVRGGDALADDLAGGEHVAGGLHGRDGHDDEHGEDGGG